MPAERPPMSKASENRRATKPIMEKRRRARINQCLSELKTLILDALNKDPSRHSKLEKADILEMTVRHLQNIQRQQMAAAISTDSSVLNKFKAGFNECASEVSRYVSRIEGVDPAMRQRLLSHLSNCLTTMTPYNQQAAFGGLLSVQIPTSDPNNNSPNKPQQVFAGGLSVIPGRLPNGEFAFLLPTHSSGGSSFHLPSSSSSGPDRNSQSSWPPSSPSPDAMSEDVLSPTCSDAGSDVFVSEPSSYHHQTSSSSSSKHHIHHPVEKMVLSPVPLMHKERTPQRQATESDSVWRPW